MQRVNELFKKRQANEQNIHHNLTAQAAQNQMMMNQSMQMRGMGQPLQQGFQNPQQMQQSPINQGQPNMGLNTNAGLGLGPHQQAMQMGGQMRPQMAMQARIAQLPPQEQAKVGQLALSKYNALNEQQRNTYRLAVQAKFTPQLVAQLQQENTDPLIYFFQTQIQSQMLSRQAGANQPGMPMQAQQRSLNQASQQLPTGPNGEFGPFSNVESIMNQQKAGLMAQEAGQMVVPASNGAGRNATPQPMGSLPGPNQGAGQPNFSHQMQPPFGAHQPTQQLKMDQRAAQTQAQIRAQAHAKQMQGQPGGLNGPGGVSQSPAMNTLNAPVRRAPMGVGQTEGHPQMGQGNMSLGQQIMDPRFNQPGQRTPMGPNGDGSRHRFLHSLLAQMPMELRNQVMSMPQDKMPEMILRWNASRQQGGPMAGRPQPQAGQLGPGNPMAQSMTQFAPGTNTPGQHPGLVNQQQQLMLQQMNQLRNPNAPRGPTDREAVMDNMPVPPKILEQLRMATPQGAASPEVKRWGWLKQLMAQKNLPLQTQRNLFNIQEAQFASILAKNGNLGAAINSQPQPNPPQQGFQPHGQSTPQMAQPTSNLPPQLAADPRFNITPQEIQKAKQHDRFSGWTDERVQSMLVQMKMQALKNRAAAQMPGAPAQPPQAAQVSQPTTTATTPALQSGNGGSVPQKQQNAGPETSTTSPVVQGRNIKQPQNNASQNAGVASTVKTGTKRPMPDDVAEVSNPSRPPAQRPQPQIPPQIPHLSPEQVAAMTPEQRQKYEAIVKSRQSAQNPPIMNEDMQRLKAIGQEQHQAGMKEQLPDILMTAEQYQETAQRIQNMCGEMNKVSKVLGRWYSVTHDDTRARLFFKLVSS